MFCTQCGQKYSSNDRFCTKCGASINCLKEKKVPSSFKDGSREKEFKETIERASFFHDRGIKKMIEKDYKGAKEDFEKVIEIYPNAPLIEETYLNLGVMYLRLGNESKALSATKKALEINPNYLDAKNNLNRMLNQKKRILNQKKFDSSISFISRVFAVPAGIVIFSLLRIFLKELMQALTNQ